MFQVKRFNVRREYGAMTKKQHYMTKDERYKLEAYLETGKGVTWIAQKLGFTRQTIYNEIKRGLCEQVKVRHGWYKDEQHYSADKAQQKHRYNQTAKGRPIKLGNDHAYADFLERQIIEKRYSPAAALAEARKAGYTTSVCVSTLYSYIDKRVFLTLSNKHLWYKGKRRKAQRPERRIAHPKLPSITDRPEIINQRSDYGHWEMDLVIGKAGSKAVLLTLTERKTRQEMIFKLADKKASSVREVFDRLEAKTQNFKEKFKSITTDNGSEFLQYEALRQSIYGGTRFQIYYCHSYAAWEKGTNENHNRMIRRWFPKGTNFEKVSKKRIAELQRWMNGYPRKVLGWKAPVDMVA